MASESINTKSVIALIGEAFPLSWFSVETDGDIVLHARMAQEHLGGGEESHRIALVPKMIPYTTFASSLSLVWEKAWGEGTRDNDWRVQDSMDILTMSDAIGWVSLTRQSIAGTEIDPHTAGRVRLPALRDLCWNHSYSYWAEKAPDPFRRIKMMTAKIVTDPKIRITYTVDLLRPGDPTCPWALISQSGMSQEALMGGRPQPLLAVPDGLVHDIERAASERRFLEDQNKAARLGKIIIRAVGAHIKEHPGTTELRVNPATDSEILCTLELPASVAVRIDGDIPKDVLRDDVGNVVCVWEPNRRL